MKIRRNHIDASYLSAMEFREHLLNEEMSAYKKTLSGMGESFLSFVRSNGVYSEEKACEMVEELTEYARCYRIYEENQWREAYRKVYGSLEGEKESIADSSPVFERFKEILPCFFYCVIRIAETDLLLDFRGEDLSGATQTFEDFLSYAGRICFYRDLDELYRDESAGEADGAHYSQMKGLYRPASVLFWLLGGERVTETYSQKQRRHFAHMQRLMENNASPQTAGTPMEEKTAPTPEDACFTPEFWDEKCSEALWLKEHFSHPQKFLSCYHVFKTKGFSDIGVTRWSDFYSSVEWAVKLYADRRGLCRVQNDNVFFSSMALLKQARKRLSLMEDIARGRQENV